MSDILLSADELVALTGYRPGPSKPLMRVRFPPAGPPTCDIR